VRELPEDLRSAIHLADVEGFCYREIAEITGTSPVTVATRIRDGRRALRRRLCGGVAVITEGAESRRTASPSWSNEGYGCRTTRPGMPPAAFALNALAASASGYTAPTCGRRCPSSTRRASSFS
jgi:hypothetical protein